MATAISNRNLLAGAGEGRLKWASVIIIKPVGSQCRSWPSPAVSGISARRRRTRPAAQPARYRCASKPHPLQFVIRQGSTVRLLLLYFLSDNNLYNNDIIPREVLLIMAIVANGLLHQRCSYHKRSHKKIRTMHTFQSLFESWHKRMSLWWKECITFVLCDTHSLIKGERITALNINNNLICHRPSPHNRY